MIKFFLLLLPFLLPIFNPAPVSAFTFRAGENLTLPSNQIIDESLLVSGKNLVIDSPIDGDLFCAGQLITINASVTGDILCAGQEIIINGEVGGNVRLAGQIISVNSVVHKNSSLFGQKVTLSSNSSSLNDSLIGAQNTEISGLVGRDLTAFAQNIELSGQVSRNARLNSQDISLSPTASISGSLTYASENNIQIASSSSIQGQIYKEEYVPRKPQAAKSDNTILTPFRIASVVALTLLGSLLAFLLPRLFLKTTDQLEREPVKTFLAGLLMLFIIPLLLILLLLTILGIPFAIAGFILYGLALFFGRIFIAVSVGRLLLSRIFTNLKNPKPLHWTLLGVPFTWVLFNIPYIGWLLSFIASVTGLGLFYYLLRPSTKASHK